MVVFRRTPNAELFYNNDEDLVWVFLGEAQLLEEYPNSLLYTVHGHNRIFAERCVVIFCPFLFLTCCFQTARHGRLQTHAKC
jgi:hypothetical protein